MIKANGYVMTETPQHKYYQAMIDRPPEPYKTLHKKCRTVTEALIYGRVVAARYKFLFEKE
jgi:hypothetical protein